MQPGGLNILGIGQTSSYINADRGREKLPFGTVVLMASIVLCNSPYVKELTDLLYESNAVTVIILNFLCFLMVSYPWVNTCFFIGQYTKKCFLVTRHMAPLFTGAVLFHYLLSPIYLGNIDKFPCISKFFEDIYSQNMDWWRECYQLAHNTTPEEVARCGRDNPITFTSLCYIRKREYLIPVDNIFNNLSQPIFGIIVSFLVLVRGISLFSKIVHAVIFFHIGCYLIPIFFTFISYRIGDILVDFFYFNFKSFSKCIPIVIRVIRLEIHTLTINSPLLIMLGTHLPIQKKPSHVGLLVTVYRYVYIFLLLFCLTSNLHVIGVKHNAPIECIKSTDYFETLISTRKEINYILFKEHGKSLLCVMEMLVVISYRSLQLLNITIHIMSLYYTLIEELSQTALVQIKYLRHLVLFILCFIVNVISKLFIIKNNFIEHVVTTSVTILSVCNSFTFTLLVFFTYGASALHKDMAFLYSDGIIPAVKVLMENLTLIVFMYFLWECHHYFVVIPMFSKDVEDFLIVYYAVVLIPMAVMILWAFALIVIESMKGNISEAFLPTKNWLPWSPPNEDFREEREVFYPEAAVKYEGDYYRCSHNCWLSNGIIADEIQMCTRTNQVIEDELKLVKFRKIFPNVYKKYKPYLKYYQES